MTESESIALNPDDLRALSALPPRKRLDALLSHEKPQEAVRALAPFSLYHLIREIGYHDTTDLAMLASPAQIQTFIDLDAWRRDEFQERGLIEWLKPVLSLEHEAFKAMLKDLDLEPMVLLLQRNIQVFTFDEDGEAPPELIATQTPYETLDGVYAVIMPDDEETVVVIRSLLKRLYSLGAHVAHRFLEACRWELHSSLQETAYEDRTRRLSEVGFVPVEEALEIYTWRNPSSTRTTWLGELQDAPEAPSLRLEETFLVPDLFREATDESQGFFSQTLRHLAALSLEGKAHPDMDRIGLALVSLTNKAMVADAVEPRDLAAARNIFIKTRGYLSMALEFLTGKNLDIAALFLMRRGLGDLFQLGYSLTLQLRKQARQLLAQGKLKLSLTDESPLGLLDNADRVFLDCLLRPRPLFAPPGQAYGEPFTTFAQIEASAARLSAFAARVTMIFGLLEVNLNALGEAVYKDEVFPPVDMIDLSTIFHTGVIRLALGEDGIKPLSLHELSTFLEGPMRSLTKAIEETSDDADALRFALESSALYQNAAKTLCAPLKTDPSTYAIASLILRKAILELVQSYGALNPAEIPGDDFQIEFLGNTALLSR